jgi:hypothetical protein
MVISLIIRKEQPKKGLCGNHTGEILRNSLLLRADKSKLFYE